MKKIFSLLSLTVAASLIAGESVEQTFPATDLKKLVVENGSGDIDVVCEDTHTARVKAKKEVFPAGCDLSIERSGTELKAVAKGNNCEVDFDIVVPRQLTLELDSGSGEIDVKGAAGKISFSTGSGEVDLEAISSAELKGHTGNGDIEVGYTHLPAKGFIDLKTGNGDASIWAPTDSGVAVSATTGNGSVVNQFRPNPAADFKLSVNTGNGKIRLLNSTRTSE